MSALAWISRHIATHCDIAPGVRGLGDPWTVRIDACEASEPPLSRMCADGRLGRHWHWCAALAEVPRG